MKNIKIEATLDKLSPCAIFNSNGDKSSRYIKGETIISDYIDEDSHIIIVQNKNGFYIVNLDGTILNSDNLYNKVSVSFAGLITIKDMNNMWGCIDSKSGELMGEGIIFTDCIGSFLDTALLFERSDGTRQMIRKDLYANNINEEIYSYLDSLIDPELIFNDSMNYKMISVIHDILSMMMQSIIKSMEKQGCAYDNVIDLDSVRDNKSDDTAINIISSLYMMKDRELMNSLYKAYSDLSSFIINIINVDEVNLIHNIIASGMLYNSINEYRGYGEYKDMEILKLIYDNDELEYSSELYDNIIKVMFKYSILMNIEIATGYKIYLNKY